MEPTALPTPPFPIPASALPLVAPKWVCDKQAHLELEAENTRLHKLVGDLLVKNQQLRLELKSKPGLALTPVTF